MQETKIEVLDNPEILLPGSRHQATSQNALPLDSRPEAVALTSQGNEALGRGDLTSARDFYAQAVADDILAPYAAHNLALADALPGRHAEALATWDAYVAALRATHASPRQFAQVEFARAHLLLLGGDYTQGWPASLARWGTGHPSCRPRVFMGKLRWRGGSLAGRATLLHGDEGFGDTIQSCRFAPAVASMSTISLCSASERVLRSELSVDRPMRRPSTAESGRCE